MLWEGHHNIGKRWTVISSKVFKGSRSENHIKVSLSWFCAVDLRDEAAASCADLDDFVHMICTFILLLITTLVLPSHLILESLVLCCLQEVHCKRVW